MPRGPGRGVSRQPAPGTGDLLASLGLGEGSDPELVLRLLAARVGLLVPSCVGVSVALQEPPLTLTVETTAPAAPAAVVPEGPATAPAGAGDPALDERGWQRDALTDAATGVRSTMTWTLRGADGSLGAVTVYAGDPDAFDGRQEEVGRLLGVGVGPGVSNADLGWSTADEARSGPRSLRDWDVVEQAVGFLAASRGVTPAEARSALEAVGARVGGGTAAAARAALGAGRGRAPGTGPVVDDTGGP